MFLDLDGRMLEVIGLIFLLGIGFVELVYDC